MRTYLLTTVLLLNMSAAGMLFAQAKKRVFQSPPVLFVATKTPDGKTQLLLQDTRDIEFVVYDRNIRSSKQYPINNYVIELDELPENGYISFQKEEGAQIVTYGSMDINTIRFMEPKIFTTRARTYQTAVAQGGYAIPTSGGTNVASSRAKVKTNPEVKAGEDDKTNFEFDNEPDANRKNVTAQPRVSKPPVEMQDAADDNENVTEDVAENVTEDVAEETPEPEPEPEPMPKEEPKPAVAEKIVYTAKDFEDFLQKSKKRRFENERNVTIGNIQASNLSAGAKAKKTDQVNLKYSKDTAWLESEKWQKDRKKTAEKITTEYEIEDIYDDYVLLKKGGNQWIYDQYSYLYEMKGVNLSDIKISEENFDEKKMEHNTLTLKSTKLPCEVIIKNEGEAQHILYGDIDLGDFVGKRQYDMQLDVTNQNSLVIKSSKGTKYNFILNEKEINVQHFKSDKKVKEEKVPVKSYCQASEKRK